MDFVFVLAKAFAVTECPRADLTDLCLKSVLLTHVTEAIVFEETMTATFDCADDVILLLVPWLVIVEEFSGEKC